jgi:hypothetical protein
MRNFLLGRLLEKRIWSRIWAERLVEPIHLNLISLFIAAFGSFRSKVAYDLIIRPQHAWGLLRAADWARRCGVSRLTVIEFGVANGTGLINLAKIAEQVSKETGVQFSVYGFDTGQGMPAARDFRDHPEHYRAGDYPCQDVEALKNALPSNAKLIIGEISATVPEFLKNISDPIAFISLDVDYYWSTYEALQILNGNPKQYLPWVILYFDDIQYDEHNRFAGQLLSIEDFNNEHDMRKIDKIRSLSETRIFRRGRWVHQMFLAHIFDHAIREKAINEKGQVVLSNPYLH